MQSLSEIREAVLSRSAEVTAIDMTELEQAATESEDVSFLLEVYWLYRQRNQTEDALRVLDRVEQEDPDYGGAALLRADIYYDRKEVRRALAIWEGVSRSEDASDAAQAKMNVLYHRRKYREVIERYEKLASADSATEPKYFANILIPCFLYTRQFQRAKELCLLMMRTHAYRSGYLGLLGMSEEGLGNRDAAEAIYSTALELNPEDLTIMARLVKLHLRRFHGRSAWAVFRDTVSKQP